MHIQGHKALPEPVRTRDWTPGAATTGQSTAMFPLNPSGAEPVQASPKTAGGVEASSDAVATKASKKTGRHEKWLDYGGPNEAAPSLYLVNDFSWGDVPRRGCKKTNNKKTTSRKSSLLNQYIY